MGSQWRNSIQSGAESVISKHQTLRIPVVLRSSSVLLRADTPGFLNEDHTDMSQDGGVGDPIPSSYFNLHYFTLLYCTVL